MYPSIEVNLDTNWDKVYVYLVLFSLSYTQSESAQMFHMGSTHIHTQIQLKFHKTHIEHLNWHYHTITIHT